MDYSHRIYGFHHRIYLHGGSLHVEASELNSILALERNRSRKMALDRYWNFLVKCVIRLPFAIFSEKIGEI